MDIRIERHYKEEILFDEDGEKGAINAPYWVLFIDSEVQAMTWNSDYISDFNGVIDAYRETCSEEAD